MVGWAERYLAWFIGANIAPEREDGKPSTLSAPPPSADPFLVLIAIIAAQWCYLKRIWR